MVHDGGGTHWADWILAITILAHSPRIRARAICLPVVVVVVVVVLVVVWWANEYIGPASN